ncbi:hypothetical protein E4U42_002612 [Claviceps africana]|uniref:Uncharacterized protein n=1 Tax=Claviceps africana TaxID=83212 RepID=A0A8K0JD02_9HYPO|nr:hypothetical protein E4U42_002612 [Claviceps africana]
MGRPRRVVDVFTISVDDSIGQGGRFTLPIQHSTAHSTATLIGLVVPSASEPGAVRWRKAWPSHPSSHPAILHPHFSAWHGIIGPGSS